MRIVEELEAVDLPPPQFISQPDHFKVIFNKELLTEAYLKKLDLSKRQLDAISYIKKQSSISNTKYQTITSVSKRTASRDLNLLKKEGYLKWHRLLVEERFMVERGHDLALFLVR